MANLTASNDADRRRALKLELAKFHTRVHQPEDPPLFTREPKGDVKSVHWRWGDLLPLLDRIGQEVDLDAGGPRRTLRLQNPGLSFGTTNTFWASIQVILPGEVATAHRHTANALRFIMKGEGAWTTVEGECYPMNEGDLVLTPGWAWHDHVHRGDKPMIWLDVLDISLMRALGATFFDPYPDDLQPVDALSDRSWRQFGSGLMSPPDAQAGPGGVNPLLAYPFGMVAKALESASGLAADPYDDVVLEYRNPMNGGSAMRTLSMQMQLLRPGFVGRKRRHTGSKLYYVIRGEGTTTAGSQAFEWSAGDFFTIAPWDWYAHRNASGKEALLWQVNDLPTLRALGYFREELA